MTRWGEQHSNGPPFGAHAHLHLAFTLLAPLAAQAQTALDDVISRKVINIAVPTDFPPYGFVSTELKPQGLGVDMANYIGPKLGVKVELVSVTSANRIAYLQTRPTGSSPPSASTPSARR